MQQQNIPGLSVALTINGQPHYFNYGVANKDTGQTVSKNTLFEIGSVSKTFTATLAGYAVASGKLTLSDPASHYLPALGGGKFEVAGKLTIKGTAQNVVVPVALTQSGPTTTATGTLPIKRLAFKIGENEWADTSMVADDVTVKFKLALTGVGKL